ncbi:hypothetical protein [Mesorhizobium sp. LNHC209A00]|uniref:hypothetical protein n=1 Tax=Mesorhizobium TaxID=68287 RepID=UPI001FD949FF|nr:hypothetical protein [Mesorhizobium sp. LNHC209A00]
MFADATLRRPGFLGRRDAETGRRGAVVLEFGDHQSSATKPFVDAVAGEDALARPESLAYRPSTRSRPSACGGRFHGCQDRAEVDAHLRRRVDSGLLHLFPQAPLHSLVAPLQSAEANR